MGMMVAAAIPALTSAATAGMGGLATAATGAEGLAVGGALLPNAWTLVAGMAKLGLSADAFLSIGGILADVWTGDIGEGGMLTYLSKAIPKYMNYIPKTFQGLNDLSEDPPHILNFVKHMLPFDKKVDADAIMLGGMKAWEKMHPRSYKIANAMLTDNQKAQLNRQYIQSLIPSANGGITGKSPVSDAQNEYFRSIPVKKVNDMILTKDGQMIETHEDDNLIAKKGAITQETGGGSSGGGAGSSNEMVNLLRELIIVNKTARVKLDGAKLAQTINTANYING
jgi:hypothetical protein